MAKKLWIDTDIGDDIDDALATSRMATPSDINGIAATSPSARSKGFKSPRKKALTTV